MKLKQEVGPISNREIRAGDVLTSGVIQNMVRQNSSLAFMHMGNRMVYHYPEERVAPQCTITAANTWTSTLQKLAGTAVDMKFGWHVQKQYNVVEVNATFATTRAVPMHMRVESSTLDDTVTTTQSNSAGPSTGQAVLTGLYGYRGLGDVMIHTLRCSLVPNLGADRMVELEIQFKAGITALNTAASNTQTGVYLMNVIIADVWEPQTEQL